MSPRARRPDCDSAVAIAYLRTSTAEQANGLKAQRDAIDRYAAAHGLQVVGYRQDVGVSGGKPAPERGNAQPRCWMVPSRVTRVRQGVSLAVTHSCVQGGGRIRCLETNERQIDE